MQASANTVRRRLVPFTFRLYALGARFLFVFVLALCLPSAEVGLYGLLTAVIAYMVYALGMDFYTYTTRELLSANPHGWRTLIRSHATLLLIAAAIVLPLALLLFAIGVLPIQTLGWFYLILITEHFGYEIDRILISLSQQGPAAVVILIRQALLPTIATPLLLVSAHFRHLDMVFGLWALFNILGIVYGVTTIRNNTPRSSSQIDWKWIWRGIRVSMPFLAGTLVLRLIFTADRQLVANEDGLEILAVYTLAMAIGNGMSSILTVGVHQFTYTSLVKAATAGDRSQFRSTMRMLWIQTLVIAGAVLLAVLATYQLGTSFLGDPIYREYAWTIPCVVAVMALYNLSMVPHYGLYAFRRDRTILTATIIAGAAFCAVSLSLIYAGIAAVTAVLVGIASASLTLVLIKYLGYRVAGRRATWRKTDGVDDSIAESNAAQ